MDELEKRRIDAELTRIANLANELNDEAAQLSAALKDLNGAKIRVEATERSLLAIQDTIFVVIREIEKEIAVIGG